MFFAKAWLVLRSCAVLACVGCGAASEDDFQGDPEASQQAIEACNTSPMSIIEYEEDDISSLLVGRWQRCVEPQARGEDVGVEFAADGRWYALTRDGNGEVIRRLGIDYGGRWKYFPAGEVHPISREPSDTPWFELDSVITDPPTFTDDPAQMRVLFSPVQSRYVPLDR